MPIHPSAIIDGELQIEEGAVIGPYCHIRGKVSLKKGTVLESHVTLGSKYGTVEVGENNVFSPGAVIGGPPQDLAYKNDSTRLKIGSNNIFREFSTVNLATTKVDGETTIGDHGYFMAYTHIGHDCKVGNHVVIANDSHLGGHTVVEDHVVIGGVCAFNQFSRVGKYAFIGGGSVVNKDILPFCKAHGDHAVCRATNKIGLMRNGFSKDEIENIHRAVRIVIMGSDTMDEAIERIYNECTKTPSIDYLVEFIRSSKRGIGK